MLWLSFRSCYLLFMSLCLLLKQYCGQKNESEEWKSPLQRRFMWKEMDKSVDDMIGRMLRGSLTVKNMLKGYIPRKAPMQYIPDYIPTETTRITYIIKNPLTKETQIIKMRPSKKIITMAQAAKYSPVLENKPNLRTQNSQKIQFEKKREMATEATFPALKGNSTPHTNAESKTRKHVQETYVKNGTFSNSGDTWTPMLKVLETRENFLLKKPKNMSSLHTSIIGELLPQPQMFVDKIPQNFNKLSSNSTHMYEVTECNIEQTVEQPYNHNYDHNYHSTTNRQEIELDKAPMEDVVYRSENYDQEETNYPDVVITNDIVNVAKLNKSADKPKTSIVRKPAATTTTNIAQDWLTSTYREQINVEDPTMHYKSIPLRLTDNVKSYDKPRHTRDRGLIKFGEKIRAGNEQRTSF